MMYVGLCDLLYSFNLFDLQARWAVLRMTGKIGLSEEEAMQAEAAEWVKE